MYGVQQTSTLGRWVAAAERSCIASRPGRAGWACAVSKVPALSIADWNSAGIGEASSYQAELAALLELLRLLPADQPVEIRMNSQSVLLAATKWCHRWRVNGWRRTQAGELAHVDLIKELDALLEGRDAQSTWVRPHQVRTVGDPINFFVDRTARAAARNQHRSATASVKSQVM